MELCQRKDVNVYWQHFMLSELRRMCGNYSWHHFMVYQFAEQRREVSAGERLPADRCECLLATFYVVSRIEEDG